MSEQDTPETRDDGTDPLDQIRFLARAESRVRIVEWLSESPPATQRELRTQLDASRTTVARSLRSLEERGWVTNDDGGYRLTRVGAAIGSEFSELLDTVRQVEELSEFLRWFPSDEFAPDFLNVDNADVTSASDGDPYAPARKQTDILRTADRIRILLPSVDLEGTRTIAEQVTEHGLEAETIVAPDLEETLESAEFSPLLRGKVETGRSAIFVSRTQLPFYLGLADDGRVQIGVEDDEGFPRALLETVGEDVREWADGLYREYRSQARHKPVEDFE
jgi:predicted transcriptional regulator